MEGTIRNISQSIESFMQCCSAKPISTVQDKTYINAQNP